MRLDFQGLVELCAPGFQNWRFEVCLVFGILRILIWISAVWIWTPNFEGLTPILRVDFSFDGSIPNFRGSTLNLRVLNLELRKPETELQSLKCKIWMPWSERQTLNVRIWIFTFAVCEFPDLPFAKCKQGIRCPDCKWQVECGVLAVCPVAAVRWCSRFWLPDCVFEAVRLRLCVCGCEVQAVCWDFEVESVWRIERLWEWDGGAWDRMRDDGVGDRVRDGERRIELLSYLVRCCDSARSLRDLRHALPTDRHTARTAIVPLLFRPFEQLAPFRREFVTNFLILPDSSPILVESQISSLRRATLWRAFLVIRIQRILKDSNWSQWIPMSSNRFIWIFNEFKRIHKDSD